MTKTKKKSNAVVEPIEAQPVPLTPAEAVAQSLELTVVNTAVARITALDVGIKELREKYADVVFDCTTEEGMAAAKAARKAVAAPRIECEKIRVEAKAPLLEIQRKLDSSAKRIKEELLKIEEPISQQIEAEEQRVEAEKQAAIAREAERVSGIREAIANITGAVSCAARLTASADIARHLQDLRAIVITEETFAEFGAEAAEALGESIQALEEMLVAAQGREEQQRKLDAERAELDRQRAEQAERDRQQRERDDAERRRKESIQQDIAELRGNQSLTASSGSDLIAGAIFDLENLPVTAEKFQEFLPQANDARAAGLARLQQLRTAALAHEAEQARLKEQRERQEAEEAERQRLAKVDARIGAIANTVVRGIQCQTSAELVRIIAEVESITIDDYYRGRECAASSAREAALGSLRVTLQGLQAREEAARQEQERAAAAAREAAEKAERERQEQLQRESEEAQRFEREGPPVGDQEVEERFAAIQRMIDCGEFQGGVNTVRATWYIRKWVKALQITTLVSP